MGDMALLDRRNKTWMVRFGPLDKHRDPDYDEVGYVFAPNPSLAIIRVSEDPWPSGRELFIRVAVPESEALRKAEKEQAKTWTTTTPL